jgi:hypothetical protein
MDSSPGCHFEVRNLLSRDMPPQAQHGWLARGSRSRDGVESVGKMTRLRHRYFNTRHEFRGNRG